MGLEKLIFDLTKNKENQQAPWKDLLEVLIGSIARSRAKKIKEDFNWLIQYIWVKASFKISARDDQALINVIHARVGQGEAVLGTVLR